MAYFRGAKNAMENGILNVRLVILTIVDVI